MFEWLKKKNDCELYAPVDGVSIPIDQVKDMVFASKMMGDGIAFQFEGDTIYAPCQAEVIMIARTKHAIGLKTSNGTEVLIHIGLDTVELNGEGFEVLVKNHSKVKKNEPLIRLNRRMMDEKKLDLTVPMIVTNLKDYQMELNEYGEVTTDQVVMKTNKL